MNQDGIWLTILEYANNKKTSISTIRRSIKAGHLKYKEEGGKYLIWTKEIKKELGQATTTEDIFEKMNLSLKLDLELVKRQNRELLEEMEDLKMLLQVYENKIQNQLPPIPEIVL